MTQFVAKRIYEPTNASDGYRVLVDRLWPRGLSKERARLDEWAKEMAPSTELRKWFRHDPAKFAAFSQQYLKEIDNNKDAPAIVARWRTYPRVTLLYGARDPASNEAVVLRNYLNS